MDESKYLEIVKHYQEMINDFEATKDYAYSLAQKIELQASDYFGRNDFLRIEDLHDFKNYSFSGTICLSITFIKNSEGGVVSKIERKYQFFYQKENGHSFKIKTNTINSTLYLFDFLYHQLIDDKSIDETISI
jgi:hypothetical protein